MFKKCTRQNKIQTTKIFQDLANDRQNMRQKGHNDSQLQNPA